MDIHLMSIEREADGATAFRHVGNATARPGYDNQPGWLSDSSGFLYASQREDGQTDIYRYELATRQSVRVCATRESEYSPTAMPDGRFSTVRVEMDGTQRLWSLSLQGDDERLLLPDVSPVGYHAWSGADLALFVLGEPHSLHLARPGEPGSRLIWPDIGRSLQPHPDGRRISFVAQENGLPARILLLDPASGETQQLAPTVQGGQDHVWTPWGALWMTSGTALVEWNGERWVQLVDWHAPSATELSRLAVSPDGQWLALVVSEPVAATPE
jgi:hypothetical protein